MHPLLPRRRFWWATGYALMTLAGIASMIWPTAPAVRSATAGAGALAEVWALFLIVGGLTSAAGAATDRWLGEYVGLGPLVAVFVIYGMSAFATGKGFTAFAGGFALLAIAAILFARWRDVSLVRDEADRLMDR